MKSSTVDINGASILVGETPTGKIEIRVQSDGPKISLVMTKAQCSTLSDLLKVHSRQP